MWILEGALIVLGLCVFEVVSSLDNAVVNADVLATMGQRWRRWFLTYGLFLAVFVVRGLLPWAIVWATIPGLGPWDAMTASFSKDPQIRESVERSAPFLLIAGGIFMIFLFLHWLFLEPKHFGLPGEEFFTRQGVWFFAVVSILLTAITWFTVRRDPMMAFAAAIGSSIFFITYGFKEYAARAERDLMARKSNLSDVSKVLYLEALDTSFSIDGVLGAFAFTMSVPLILLGNGIGAMVVRELSVRGVERIKRYAYLKNGAMYSILFLGVFMVLESFHVPIPKAAVPLVTVTIVGLFFAKSVAHNRRNEANKNLAEQ